MTPKNRKAGGATGKLEPVTTAKRNDLPEGYPPPPNRPSKPEEVVPINPPHRVERKRYFDFKDGRRFWSDESSLYTHWSAAPVYEREVEWKRDDCPPPPPPGGWILSGPIHEYTTPVDLKRLTQEQRMELARRGLAFAALPELQISEWEHFNKSIRIKADCLEEIRQYFERYYYEEIILSGKTEAGFIDWLATKGMTEPVQSMAKANGGTTASPSKRTRHDWGDRPLRFLQSLSNCDPFKRGIIGPWIKTDCLKHPLNHTDQKKLAAVLSKDLTKYRKKHPERRE
ncbi:MAG: hypothetical protein NTX50_22085 [Candidatus Sumerlaeota bacterium]|nr:hypothetical protein [Candidatus Sumerlaeota bacterium]